MKRISLSLFFVMGLALVGCSNHSKENKETDIEEEEIGCLCCPIEEAPADSITPDANK